MLLKHFFKEYYERENEPDIFDTLCKENELSNKKMRALLKDLGYFYSQSEKRYIYENEEPEPLETDLKEAAAAGKRAPGTSNRHTKNIQAAQKNSHTEYEEHTKNALLEAIKHNSSILQNIYETQTAICEKINNSNNSHEQFTIYLERQLELLTIIAGSAAHLDESITGQKTPESLLSRIYNMSIQKDSARKTLTLFAPIAHKLDDFAEARHLNKSAIVSAALENFFEQIEKKDK